MDIIKDPSKAKLLVIMENGLGKCTTLEDYRIQTRGGSGIKTANITTKTGSIIGAKIIEENTKEDLMMVSKQGQIIRMNLQSIPSQGRTTQGVYLMRMNENDKVASTTILETDDGKDVGPAVPEEQAQLLEEVK